MEITNMTGAFASVFSAIFALMGVPILYAILTIDPPLARSFYWFLFLLYVVCSAGLIVYATNKPIVIMKIEKDGSFILATKHLLGRKVRSFKSSDLTDLYVHESTDQDGDPYYRICLRVFDGSIFCVSEGWNKEEMLKLHNIVKSKILYSVAPP